MRAQPFFVGLGAPARAIRNHEMAVLDLGQVGEQLVIPSEPIDVDLHDAEIRDRGAEMRVHQAAEMAIEIEDRKSTRLNSSHANISYAVFCLKKKNEHATEAAPRLPMRKTRMTHC